MKKNKYSCLKKRNEFEEETCSSFVFENHIMEYENDSKNWKKSTREWRKHIQKMTKQTKSEKVIIYTVLVVW